MAPVKTALEIPDFAFREAKLAAAEGAFRCASCHGGSPGKAKPLPRGGYLAHGWNTL